jgi:hypothetical protein
LRSKNANEKKKLEDSVRQYNIVNRLLETDLKVADVTPDSVLDGNFPWIDRQDKGIYIENLGISFDRITVIVGGFLVDGIFEH